MSKEIWGWSEDQEHYHSHCDTKEDAIAEGRTSCDGDFYVGMGEHPSQLQFAPDVERIVEDMGEAAYEECGDAAEDWPEVTDSAKGKLRTMIELWMIEHVPCTFYMIESDTVEKIEMEIK